MTTQALPAPHRPTGGVTPHGVEPSRAADILGLVFLAVGFSIDLVAFSSALALLDDQMPMWLAWVVAIGASLMAMFLMFEAGQMESQRRETTMGRHGRGIIRALIGIWLMAGVAATFIRMTIDHGTGGSDPFASTEAVSDPFGGAADPFGSAAATTGLDLGFATIYYENVPMALFMFVLYLGVGIGAYLFGRRSHQPLLTDLRRARRAEKKQRAALTSLQRKRDRAATESAALETARDEVRAHHEELARLTALEAALASYSETSGRRNALADQRLAAEQLDARLSADIADVPGQVVADKRSAEAVGRNAAQHARTMLHRHLGDPSRTVMDTDLIDLRPARSTSTTEA